MSSSLRYTLLLRSDYELRGWSTWRAVHKPSGRIFVHRHRGSSYSTPAIAIAALQDAEAVLDEYLIVLHQLIQTDIGVDPSSREPVCVTPNEYRIGPLIQRMGEPWTPEEYETDDDIPF